MIDRATLMQDLAGAKALAEVVSDMVRITCIVHYRMDEVEDIKRAIATQLGSMAMKHIAAKRMRTEKEVAETLRDIVLGVRDITEAYITTNLEDKHATV